MAVLSEEKTQDAKMQYHDLYDEPNTEIITALAEEAPNDISPIIINYNVNKRKDDFIAETKNQPKELLIKTVEFLKVKSRTNHPTTLAKTIITGIQNYFHEMCEACGEHYTVKFHDTPTLRCISCNQGCHEKCYAVCKQLPGLEWYCSSHTSGEAKPKGEETERPPADPAAEPEEPKNDQDDSDSDKSLPILQNEQPLCKFFLNSRCKHGVNGQNCKFRHLKVCRRFLNHGIHKQHGCNLGRNCQYHHPKMCRTSLFNQVCNRENCKFSHIKGTKHEEIPMRNEPDSNHHQQVWSQQSVNPPTINASNRSTSEEHFLGIAAQLQKQLAVMQHQQQFMMTRLESISVAHTPQPLQQQPNPHPEQQRVRIEHMNNPEAQHFLNHQINPLHQNQAIYQHPQPQYPGHV